MKFRLPRSEEAPRSDRKPVLDTQRLIGDEMTTLTCGSCGQDLYLPVKTILSTWQCPECKAITLK